MWGNNGFWINDPLFLQSKPDEKNSIWKKAKYLINGIL